MSINKDFLYFSKSATIEKVLQAYQEGGGQSWWLLVSGREDDYTICTFGSLLPYLTGHTPHIVHKLGDCLICSGMDPIFWTDTGALVEEALADETICRRPVSSLPMVEATAVGFQTDEEIDSHWLWENDYAFLVNHGTVVKRNGAVYGVYIEQMKGEPGSMPDF